MPARILIAVTHLLGSGHLVRAQHLAQALAGAGHEVTLVSGGTALRRPVNPTYAFAQLPPVKVEGVDFRNLLDEEGRSIAPERRAARRDMLAGLARGILPDVVITEHFPFGRRQLADEFLTMIAAARAANPAVLVLSSIRDVLVAPRPDRVAEAHRRLAELFDGVLVHGDRAFLPLEASWPVTEELAERLLYTGYIAEPSRRAQRADPAAAGPDAPLDCSPDARHDGRGDILVSGGGSGAALPLFDLCLAAARLIGSTPRWRLLVGRGLREAEFERLRSAAPSHVTVEWARPDFPALLAACALSISQAGYNTVLDLLAAGRPAVVVPFDAGGETEQGIRAAAMERAGLASVLRLSDAAPERLAEMVQAMSAGPVPPAIALDRDGTAGTVAAIARLLAERPRCL